MKSILDGHIVLSRKLSEKAHFPAIDIAGSISRVANQLLDGSTIEAANRLRAAFADYETSRTMIESGIYQSGSSSAIDRAIALHEPIRKFLMQSEAEPPDLRASDRRIRQLVIAERPV